MEEKHLECQPSALPVCGPRAAHQSSGRGPFSHILSPFFNVFSPDNQHSEHLLGKLQATSWSSVGAEMPVSPGIVSLT